MTTRILGISAFYHDSAAALLIDGDIAAAAQEERFTRIKADSRYPRHAVEYCLESAALHIRDIDAVVFYEKPFTKFERLVETYLGVAPEGFQSFREALPRWAASKLQLPRELKSWLGSSYRGPLYFANHHDSHASSAFFPSPFEEAAILTLDAVGEWATGALGIGRGNRVKLLRQQEFPHSLGMLYSAFTYYTGFKVNSGEYKVMGLAPYGKPRFVDLIWENIVRLAEDGSLWMDMTFFNYCQGLTMTSEKFHRLFGGPPRRPETRLTQKEMDLAASVQVVCEQVVLKAARHAHELTGLKQLAMAGGVALNCVANGRLLREAPFDDIWVQPAAGDAGGALGAALLVWHHLLDHPRTANPSDSQQASLLGPAYCDEDIGLFLDAVGARYECIENERHLLERVTELMADEQIVGWFHGRMEYGPRALGARSIIGDARSPRMQQKMNLKIKFRESFRPFAPCVLREHAHKIFELDQRQESPYMLLVAPVRSEMRIALNDGDKQRLEDPDLCVRVAVPRSRVPAITHVDYSARVQTVDELRHGRYYRLMQQFYERTGCPVIVNTSFNIRGEPIVCTPQDAYHCFMATDIDCLVLENHILVKSEQPSELLEDAAAYRAQYALD